MKLSDYVIDFLAKEGVQCIFGLTGGAVVHLFDSVAKNKKTFPIFTQHEQAAAFAAEAYARITNNLGAAIVTTGPGGTNAITGVCAAWLDSIPCIYISGQARLVHTTKGKPIRQLGTQQFDIIPIVSHITKYAVMIEDPKMIKYHFQKAIYFAKTGRPGPVWIDIPLDIQWASIEPDQLQSFDSKELECEIFNYPTESEINKCIELIMYSKRPLILAGYGIRLAHAEDEFKQLIRALNIPFVSSWNTSDLLPTSNELYLGRPGFVAQRGANLAVQNCDLLLAIGSHLSIQLTGTNFKSFARGAKIIMVDIDKGEIENETVHIDLPIQCDAKIFLLNLFKKINKDYIPEIDDWRKKFSQYKLKYNSIPIEWFKQKKHVNPYVFINTLSKQLKEGDIAVVDGGGTTVYISFQSFEVKKYQRIIISSGLCSMGSGLAESIGACFANKKRRTICLSGDGSMQLNIHELQTIVHHNLPIKIFVFCNNGYLSIRHTQDGFLDSKYVGSSKNGGLSLPDISKVAKAYGLKTMKIKNQKGLRDKIQSALKLPGPVLCEITVSEEQQIIPQQGFDRKEDGTYVSRPLEDMYPYLDRIEFYENMIIEPLAESKIKRSKYRGRD